MQISLYHPQTPWLPQSVQQCKKISGFVESTVSVIQKEFKLWKLQNEDLEGSSRIRITTRSTEKRA